MSRWDGMYVTEGVKKSLTCNVFLIPFLQNFILFFPVTVSTVTLLTSTCHRHQSPKEKRTSET